MGGATLDRTGTYRYLLVREWDGAAPRVAMVLLNPSTADAVRDDPTVRRCIGFARRWGCGRLAVVNLFALRARDPTVLAGAPEPVGPGNDRHIREAAAAADLVVAAWGRGGGLRDRGARVASLLARVAPVFCLGVTMGGQPRHPLYLPAATPLRRWLDGPEKNARGNRSDAGGAGRGERSGWV